MTKAPTQPMHLKAGETDASSKASVTKVEKRRAPFARKFKVSIEELVEMQRDRWNNGFLRDGITDHDVAFHLFEEDHKTRWLFRELNLDETDPFHWRAIVEAFTRTHVADLGAPKKASKCKGRRELLQLTRHMDTIRREKLNGEWLASRAVEHHMRVSPYRERYRSKPRALRKKIERVAKSIGPMDDEAMDRAYDAYPGGQYYRNPFIETIEEMDEKETARRDDDDSL